MFKTAPRSLLPAALLSALVGLAGCHISIGSGSSNPNHVHGKPAHRSPSRSSTQSSGKTSKPIPKKTTSTDTDADAKADPEPTRDPASDKTTEGPHRDQPTSDPKRTPPSSEPTRTEPSDPTRKPAKHIGNKTQNGGSAPGDAGGADDPGDAGDAGGEDAGGASGNTIKRPGSVVAPTRDEGGGAKDLGRTGTLTAPK